MLPKRRLNILELIKLFLVTDRGLVAFAGTAYTTI